MDILSNERNDFAGHRRLAINTVTTNPTDDELRAVAREHLRRTRVDVVVIFVWSPPGLFGQMPYDVAHIQVARGAKAWSGDGRWVPGTPDSVQKYVEGLARRTRIVAVIDRREPKERGRTA